MSRRKNRSKESRRWGATPLLCIVLTGLLFGGVALAYVRVKNQHSQLGEQKRKLETAILDTEEQIRLTEGRIATTLELGRLEERLQRAGSSLRPIRTADVVELVVEAEVHGRTSQVQVSAGKEDGR